jgi:hypothetical protein
MKGIYLLQIIFGCLLIFLLTTAVCVNAQENSQAKELQLYENLKERFNIFLAFQKEKNYAKLYDMLAQEQRKAITKEFFVETYQNLEKNDDDRLTNFGIKRVGLLQQSDFGIVEGCGEYTKNKKKKYYESQVEAVYENDDWYFRSLIGASVGFGTPLKKCKMPKCLLVKR